MISRLTTNWNFPRAIRLVMGVLVLAQAIMLREYVLAAVGGIIALLALLNVSTCGAAGCTPGTNANRTNSRSSKRIDYETLDIPK